MSQDAPGRVAYFSLRAPVPSGAYLDDDQLVVVGDSAPGALKSVIGGRELIRLRGDHNVLNTLAACAITGAAGISPEAMRRAIESFTGVEHRMEPVATINGVTWINDSIATAPERVIAALRSYNEPLVLLAGGRDKKLPWGEMADLAAEKCRAVIAFGEFGPQVAEHMRRAKTENPAARLDRIEVVAGLDEAVPLAHSIALPGDLVLLSPGGTSYDAYMDFAARGVHFRALVRGLTEKD
jgi:UDP-N-acetylmuramoylalanine--D-glutamate ligase